MGLINVLICDKCRVQADDVEETSISHSIVRRGSTRYVGDLCTKCWKELLETYALQSDTLKSRPIDIVRVEEIPKTP